MSSVLEPKDLGIYQFTYRDLLEMERAGILSEDERVELLSGVLYKMTVHPPHTFVTSELIERFMVFNAGAKVLSQQPLRLSERLDATELPQPDVFLVERKLYLDHPQPQDVYLVVEVSDTTLKKDQTLKLPLYASADISECWIVNLVQRRIEVYTQPEASNYAHCVHHELTDRFELSRFPGEAQRWLNEGVHSLLDKHQS